MKFSVLLPTRNGEALLANCIRSVLEQDYPDFELVISDNANTDATPEILRSFKDNPRVKVIRQTKVVPVSENWNAVLRESCGDYFLMMGDDDYLLPGALRKLDEILMRYQNPDCVLYNGYSFIAPDAITDNCTGFWAREHFQYGPDFCGEGLIDRTHRQDIIHDMFHFRQRIPLNMQTTLFSRHAIEKLKGEIFRAPFPDHFLLNALLLVADTWIYLPERLIIVGVSPKSFGHYFYSQDAEGGLSYLGISIHFPGKLPGSVLLNGMYIWLIALKTQYPNELAPIEIDRTRYIRGQVYTWLQQYSHGGIGMGEFIARFSTFTLDDWKRLMLTPFDRESWQYLGRVVRQRKKSQVDSLWQQLTPLVGIVNIREFAEWIHEHPEN